MRRNPDSLQSHELHVRSLLRATRIVAKRCKNAEAP
jgi:hypothetical protein